MDELLNANVSFIKKEYAAAVAGYQKLMRENQDPIAACNLGFLYQQGLGVERDYEKAIQCYHASCYEDGGVGYFNLALIYQRGLGVPVDLDRSLDLMQKSANLGCPDAQLYLALVALLQYFYDPINIDCISLIPFYHVIYQEEGAVPLLGEAENSKAQKIEDSRFELVQKNHLEEAAACGYYTSLIVGHEEDPYAERQVTDAKFMLGQAYIEGVLEGRSADGYQLIAEAATEGSADAARYLLANSDVAMAYGIDLPPASVLKQISNKN